MHPAVPFSRSRCRYRSRRHKAILAMVMTLLVGCGSVTSGSGGEGPVYRGDAAFHPPRPVPPLALTDYQGQPFDIAQARGRAVLVTFLYTHCPDVCPVIASKLQGAQARLGAEADRVVLVAVSSDPVGDTPAAVASFLAARGFRPGQIHYLLGSAAQLELVRAHWAVAASPDSQTAGVVDHSAPVFGITAGGKLTTIYNPDFKTADLVHDAPILASR